MSVLQDGRAIIANMTLEHVKIGLVKTMLNVSISFWIISACKYMLVLPLKVFKRFMELGVHLVLTENNVKLHLNVALAILACMEANVKILDPV